MKPLDPRLLPHLAPARWPLVGVLVGGVLSGGLVVAQAFAVAALVSALLAGNQATAWTAGLALAGVTAGRAGVGWGVDACAARASASVTTTLRRRLVAAALALGQLGLSRRRSGELALLATRGVAAVDPYLTRYLPALVLAATLPPLTLLAIASQDLLSAGIVLLTLPLVPVFAALVGMATRDRAEQQWRVLAGLSGHFLDVMRGLPTLVVHRRATAQAASIRRITDRYRRATNQTLRLAFASSAVLELVATVSVALVAVVVGLRLAAGTLDLRTALTVLLLAPEAYWPLRRVGAEFHAAAEGTATFEATDALLATASPPAAPAAEAPGACGPGSGITLDAVSVCFPGRSVPALAGLSGHIPGRGLTAVTGPSGCGKSTLLSVLTAELPVSGGHVGVGGTDLAAVDREQWQTRIAWLPQRPWFLPGTVRDNVRLGNPDAGDTAVWEALERVGLGERVLTLPDGLDQLIGEDGLGLSAGERARLALARVVVADRPLVLLDEPTAHLDETTEQVIASTLRWLADHRAVVVVAHRASLVRAADHVLALPASPGASAPAQVGRPGTPGPPAPAPVPGSPEQPPRGPSWTRRPGVRLAAGALLGALAAASGVALTATAGWLIARAAQQPPVLTLMVAIVAVRAFGLARPGLRYAERLVSHDAALRLLAERRAAVYDVLVPLVPGRLGRQRGDVLASVVDDVDALMDKQLRVRAPLATCLLVAAMSVAFAGWVLPAAGLVVLTVLVAGGGLTLLVGRLGVAAAEQDVVTGRGRVSSLVVQVLQGAPELRMWQAGDRVLDGIDRAGRDSALAGRRSARAAATGRTAAVLAAGGGMLGMAKVGLTGLASGTVSGPMVALLVLLPLALLEVLTPLADVAALQVRTRAADARLATLAATEPAVADPVDPAPATGSTATALDRVSAGWGAAPALRDLSLDLPPGRRLGVVGPSGSGKSTLAALLLRFLDPRTGAVRLGPLDLRHIRLDDVHRTVGLVDDDPHVFASTLAENVRLARPSATDAEVEHAVRSAALGAWLDGLPHGLHTMLGDGHAHVSGGERARIGLARALLADQPVLVLDEPTAHLDTATARTVTDDLLAAGADRTIVWITHGTVGLDRMDEVLDLVRPPAPLARSSAAGGGCC